MKKIIIFVICLVSFSYTAKAFLGEDLGSNLYNNIDEGYEEMELKQYEYELSGQGESIKENVNKILELEGLGGCINNELTVEGVEKIALGDVESLYNIISDDCKNEDGSITVDKITDAQNTIKKIHNLFKTKASDKSKKINDISRIGIYSDGSIENSPFDLIADLEDIDKIIFTSEIEYEGKEYSNNDELFEDLFDDGPDVNYLSEVNNNTTGNELGDDNKLITSSSGSSTGGDLGSNTSDILSANICADDSTNSGLSTGSINTLLTEFETSSNIEWNDIFTGTNTMSGSNVEWNDVFAGTNTMGDYESVNDNSMWPCENFFCITIDFITYNHRLLGGGQNISIEYLVNRSNDHLKKFASTSLMPTTMTINNFELGFKNISLPDMFHLGFVITSKPIPILDIELEEKDDKENKSKFTKTNLLEEYYKNIGLEYERKNDINIFRAKEEELKTVIDSAELTNYDVVKKLKDLENFKNKYGGKNTYVGKNVIKKVTNDELSDFEKQFLELRKFSASIYNYVVNVDEIVKQMNKIPIEK